MIEVKLKGLAEAMRKYDEKVKDARSSLSVVRTAIGKKCPDKHLLCLECQAHEAVDFLEEFFG
jgi:hypothetical protein